VAQRTGDKRFLALPAKTASAGILLALAVAVLSLGGCGGDSASSGDGATSSTAAAAKDQAAAPGSSTEGRATAHGQDKAQADKDTSAQAGNSPSADPAPGSGQKHGARIAQPKGPREQAPSSAELANATVADIALTSPSLPLGSGGPAPLTATYTCDGKGEWPALSWSGVPAGSSELILYAMNVAPVAGKLFVDWAVAGLEPGLTGIEAGKLPKGAVVGTNSFGKRGYEICPEGSEVFIFALYALPRSLSPRPGFDARELRKEILAVSGNVGLYSAAYTRG
jgi:phosphatidylethanolamine-binding protein (PEBP) family uncharacterized protein